MVACKWYDYSTKGTLVILINASEYINICDIKKDLLKLPDDVIKQILYESDIHTVINYCNTKKYQSACNDKNLWKFIFTRDKIKIVSEPNNAAEWISMYKNV